MICPIFCLYQYPLKELTFLPSFSQNIKLTKETITLLAICTAEAAEPGFEPSMPRSQGYFAHDNKLFRS